MYGYKLMRDIKSIIFEFKLSLLIKDATNIIKVIQIELNKNANPPYLWAYRLKPSTTSLCPYGILVITPENTKSYAN